MPQTPNVVLRERLITALDARWHGGLGIVLGGPGLGKSTLLRHAIFESATLGRGTEVLIRCRSEWTATALHAEICRQLLLPADETAAGDPRTELIAEYLWSAAPDRTGIVLDDLHLLDESGISYVLELREALPSNAHLLVASRENPLLTALLITANPAFVLDGGELLFTDGEVDQFATEANAEVSALQRAGGWPAVLALTASAGSDVAGAYLYQKVLAGLSRRQQGDLAVAATLGDLDEELAPKVLDGKASELLAIPLVEKLGGGIIVHDLWREPLAGLVDDGRLNEARRIAASHAEAYGDVDRAVSILCEGALIHEARNVVLRHIATGADRVPVDRVDRWLRTITSADQALLRQLLQLLRTGLIAGSLTDLELDEITARCRQANEFDLEAVVCEIRFAVAWSADEADACVATSERLAELHAEGVDAAAHGNFLRDVTLARSQGDNTKVLELIHEARESLKPSAGPDWSTSLELETLVSLGRPFEALAVVEEAEARLAERKVRSVTYGLTYWFAGRPLAALRSLDAILNEPGRFKSLERSWRATSDLFRGYRGIEVVDILPAALEEDEIFSLYSRVCEGLAEVARHVDRGDDEVASAMIADLAERLPPSGGITLQAWFMGVAMWYGLRPDDRPLLDSFMTENLYGQTGALCQSFVHGRETGEIPDELIDQWPTPAQVGTLLPARWAGEVALRLPPERSALRDAILDGLEGKGRQALDRLADGTDAGLADRARMLVGDRPNAPGDLVKVRLFGLPYLEVPGHDDQSDWRRGRVRALFGFLATRPRTTREAAVDALWPDLDLQAGRRNLRVTMSYLTRTLEPARTKNAPPWFLRSDGETLSLHQEGLDLDLSRLRTALKEASAHRVGGVASKSIESLREAVEAYGGAFLEGLDDEWILAERGALEREVLSACLRLSALLQAGRSDDAAHWARRAIEIDPFSIDAHEALVEALQGGSPREIDAARDRLVQLLNE